MLNWFSKRINDLHKEDRRGEKGFTLIELLVVVIIIGILAAIAIPVFLGQRERAQDSAAQSLVRSAATTMETCFADAETYAGCDAAALEAIEPNTTWVDAATGDAEDDEVGISGLAEDTYTLASTSGSDTNFILTRAADGTISRTTTNPTGTW